MTHHISHPASKSKSPQPAHHDLVDTDEIPPDFNPASMPIISRHFFGIEPFCSVGAVTAQIVQDLKYRRKIKRLVAKGERVVGEMLAELAADRNLGTAIDEALDRYIEIPDEALDVANGRDFPPAPLHEVQS